MYGLVFEPNHRGELALGEFLVEDVGSSPVRLFLQLCVDVARLLPCGSDESNDYSSVLPDHFHGRCEIGVVGHSNDLIDFVAYRIAERVECECDICLANAVRIGAVKYLTAGI